MVEKGHKNVKYFTTSSFNIKVTIELRRFSKEQIKIKGHKGN